MGEGRQPVTELDDLGGGGALLRPELLGPRPRTGSPRRRPRSPRPRPGPRPPRWPRAHLGPRRWWPTLPRPAGSVGPPPPLRPGASSPVPRVEAPIGSFPAAPPARGRPEAAADSITAVAVPEPPRGQHRSPEGTGHPGVGLSSAAATRRLAPTSPPRHRRSPRRRLRGGTGRESHPARRAPSRHGGGDGRSRCRPLEGVGGQQGLRRGRCSRARRHRGLLRGACAGWGVGSSRYEKGRSLLKADLVIASNRGPMSFALDQEGRPVPAGSAGGLAAALHPQLEGSGATWVACAMSDADRRATAEGLMTERGLHLAHGPTRQRHLSHGLRRGGQLDFVVLAPPPVRPGPATVLRPPLGPGLGGVPRVQRAVRGRCGRGGGRGGHGARRRTTT